MAKLHRLTIDALRNLSAVDLELSPRFNVFYGHNGSGKTSVLEAIQLLAQGRTFRSNLNQRLIQHHQERLVVHAELTDQQTLGIEKAQRRKTRLKHNGQEVNSIAMLAQQLPLQLIHPDRFRLIAEAASYRRQYLDWGLFHVEPSFFPTWQRYRAALMQRNAALKQQQPHQQVAVWDHAMMELATALDQQRQAFVEQFQAPFQSHRSALLPVAVTLAYCRGWPEEQSLSDIWQRGFQWDLAQGHTRYGPHRADLQWLVEGHPANAILSRGQQKLLVAAMVLTQAQILQQKTGQSCLFLIDDLTAELDQTGRIRWLDVLSSTSSQVCVTGIDEQSLDFLSDYGEVAKFHVEHGRVQAMVAV